MLKHTCHPLPRVPNVPNNIIEQNIVKEAAWTISNITAGNTTQTQAVLDAGIFAHIHTVLQKGDVKSQKEAAWAVTNTTIAIKIMRNVK